jgi:hypothetical protein
MIGLGVITMTRRENKGNQVIYKYFKDIVHEHGLKSPHRTLLTGEIDHPSTERVEPVWGCLITQAVWNEPP